MRDMKARKKRKKKTKKDTYLTGYKWGDFFLVGAVIVGIIKYGYPIIRSYFGIE